MGRKKGVLPGRTSSGSVCVEEAGAQIEERKNGSRLAHDSSLR